MTEREWLLFTPQLPAFPSSVRVMVWRRLQNAGAVSLQNGVWILPRSPERERLIGDLFAEVERQGGSGFILTADAADPTFHARIVARFQAERAQRRSESRLGPLSRRVRGLYRDGLHEGRARTRVCVGVAAGGRITCGACSFIM